MAKIKAVFDADILIHLIKTNSIEFASETIGDIYLSEYVYKKEINLQTIEGKKIEKLRNKGIIKILSFNSLTNSQKKVYCDTYRLLKEQDVSDNHDDNPINEGERVTASFAKACNIYYYMSDDNRASYHIKSLTSVDIINYCDILFMHLIAYNKKKEKELRESYEKFIGLYEKDKVPRILRIGARTCTFKEAMGISFTKFQKTKNLSNLLKKIKSNVNSEVATD
ncbi:MAG: hypothetical protein E6X82_03785 [Clostridium sp.]|nr:hypothetical protein [Clostridium sp.]